MSDFSRLESKLRKLAERERPNPGRRTLSGANAEARLKHLLGEVDEIILPRQLHLSTGPDATLSFAVASRRLQAVLAPLPKVATAAEDFAGKALGAGDDATLGTLKAVVLAVLGSEKEITIRTERQTPNTSFPGESGVPVGALARSWGISPDDLGGGAPDPIEALTRFLSRAGENAVAWLRIDGEDVSATGGPEAEVATLGDALGALLDTFFQKRAALALPESAPVCLALEPMQAERVVVLAHHVTAMAVLSIPKGAEATVLGAWSAATRAA